MKKRSVPKGSQKTVDEIILGLTGQERVIVQRLRSLILECLPKATEKGYYGPSVPFYGGNRMICFIWPPSIFWGKKRTLEKQLEKGVTLGFCQGYLMANENGVLLAEGRKQVYCMYIKSPQEINDEQIRALLFEAGMIDESFAKKNKNKKRIGRG